MLPESNEKRTRSVAVFFFKLILGGVYLIQTVVDELLENDSYLHESDKKDGLMGCRKNSSCRKKAAKKQPV